MEWFKLCDGVECELFRALAEKLRSCIFEKMLQESDFKLTDFGDAVVEDVMDRLKKKRLMNLVEVEYLTSFFNRATKYQPHYQSLVNFSKILAKF